MLINIDDTFSSRHDNDTCRILAQDGISNHHSQYILTPPYSRVHYTDREIPHQHSRRTLGDDLKSNTQSSCSDSLQGQANTTRAMLSNAIDPLEAKHDCLYHSTIQCQEGQSTSSQHDSSRIPKQITCDKRAGMPIRTYATSLDLMHQALQIKPSHEIAHDNLSIQRTEVEQIDQNSAPYKTPTTVDLYVSEIPGSAPSELGSGLLFAGRLLDRPKHIATDTCLQKAWCEAHRTFPIPNKTIYPTYHSHGIVAYNVSENDSHLSLDKGSQYLEKKRSPYTSAFHEELAKIKLPISASKIGAPNDLPLLLPKGISSCSPSMNRGKFTYSATAATANSDHNRALTQIDPLVRFCPPRVAFTSDHYTISDLPSIDLERYMSKFNQTVKIITGTKKKQRIWPITMITSKTIQSFYAWHTKRTRDAREQTIAFTLMDVFWQMGPELVMPEGDSNAFRILKQSIWDFFWTAHRLNKDIRRFRVKIERSQMIPITNTQLSDAFDAPQRSLVNKVMADDGHTHSISHVNKSSAPIRHTDCQYQGCDLSKLEYFPSEPTPATKSYDCEPGQAIESSKQQLPKTPKPVSNSPFRILGNFSCRLDSRNNDRRLSLNFISPNSIQRINSNLNPDLPTLPRIPALDAPLKLPARSDKPINAPV